MSKQKEIKISQEVDIIKAVAEARQLSSEAGFRENQQYAIATAVSELARNIFRYALKGEIVLKIIERKTQKGIEVIAEDKGPGIEHLGKAMKDHFTTSQDGSLGLGLPGVKRLMDEFVLDTEHKRGTKIITRKWVR